MSRHRAEAGWGLLPALLVGLILLIYGLGSITAPEPAVAPTPAPTVTVTRPFPGPTPTITQSYLIYVTPNPENTL